MEAARRDLKITIGPVHHPIYFQDEAGAVMPLAGITFRAQLRKTRESASIAVEFTVTVDPDLGIVWLDATEAALRAIGAGSYVWGLDADGEEWLWGEVELKQDVVHG